jgi:hypothetical protein
LSQSEVRGLQLLAELLGNPSGVIVQETLDLAAKNGKALEFRVNFKGGVAISAHTRFQYAYYPEKSRAALELVNRFLAKTGDSRSDLEGGADVVLLENGSMKVVEFNFGDRSGYTLPAVSPIAANLYFSKLQGKPTVLINELDRIFFGPIQDQIQFLNELLPAEKYWVESVSEIYVAEVIAYFRDRAMVEYRKASGGFLTGDSVLRYLKHISKGLRNKNPELESDLAFIYESTKSYLRRTIE